MQIHLKLIFAIASGSLLVGCDQPKIDHSKIRESGFVYCGQGEPDTFNPQLVDSGVTVDALAPQIFDTLLTLDNEQNTPQPSLAKSWSVSRDGLTYRFELESHVHFQSTPYFSPTRSLNAQDVLFTFNRLLDPEHPYHKVNGHYPWFSAVGFNRLIDKIQMINDTSIEFILSRPDNSFLSLLATPYSSIHSAEYANQLAAHQANQLLQIRHLLIAQHNAINAQNQAKVDQEAMWQAARETATKRLSPQTLPPGRNWSVTDAF